MLNILIRTSRRPRFFEDCVRSVESQSYKDWRIIVSVDDNYTETYVKPYGYQYIKVLRSNSQCFWNTYFNTLVGEIKNGWIIYLDDDAQLMPGALQIIVDHCKDNSLLVWKYQFANGRIIPEKNFWKKQPQRKHIDTGCFAHQKKHFMDWDGLRAADYRIVFQLYQKLKPIWINKILIKAGNNGTIGNRKDK